MGARAIKSHITVVLAILLAIGMFLTSMVAIVFWQRSLIQAEMQRIISTLSAVVDNADSTAFPQHHLLPPALLQRLQQNLEASCLLLSTPTLTISFPENCEHKLQEAPVLHELLNQVSNSGQALSKVIDDAPALPFFGRKQLITATPIQHQGFQGGIAVLTTLQSVDDQIQRGRHTLFVYILVNIIILTTIGLFRFIQIILRPIEQLVTMTNSYQGNYQDSASDSFLLNQGDNAFSQLSIALNQMVRRIDDDRQKLRETVSSLKKANLQLLSAQQQMVQTEKMAAIGKLAAGLAHEIGNPLGIIQGYIELLGQAGLSPEDQQQFAARSLQELGRINRLIHQLLNFSHPSVAGSGNIEIHPLIQELVNMLQAQTSLKSLDFQLSLTALDDLVLASGESLHQVFLNCLLNAIDAIKERYSSAGITGDQKAINGGKILISTSNTSNDKGGPCIQISIADNGIGIKDADRGNLFDPFFTTKEPGKGTGLGLSVSHALVEGIGGHMQIQGQEGQGATVIILLPVQKTEKTRL
jgi:signal transduction histidine kinase